MCKLNQVFKKLTVVSLLMFIGFLTPGYGYMGNLPKLGDKTHPEQKNNYRKTVPKVKPSSIVVPRATIGHKKNKYSSYLADIKEVYQLLYELKNILEGKRRDKIQLFCAKVNYLNLYVDILEKKYKNSPASYYESYNQLLMLDKYLTEIVVYKKGMERYRELNTGTLENKLRDRMYLEQKIEKAIVPINTVIMIIDETG